MVVKPSDLRRNLFSYLDRCITDREVIDVPRHGTIVRIAVRGARVPIAELPLRREAVVDAQSLDSFSPSEWNP